MTVQSKIVPRTAAMIACSASGSAGVIPSQELPKFKTAKQRRQDRTSSKGWKDRVAGVGCILCRLLGQAQSGKTDLHHVREGQGGSRRASDYLVIPLCSDGCHKGPHGIHGDRALLKLAKVDELDLLAATLDVIEGSGNGH